MDTPPQLHSDPEKAAEMAVNAVISYLNGSGLKEHNDRNAWVDQVCAKIRSRIGM
jgi:hypothetical protein